jgi:hypothetical protein
VHEGVVGYELLWDSSNEVLPAGHELPRFVPGTAVAVAAASLQLYRALAE